MQTRWSRRSKTLKVLKEFARLYGHFESSEADINVPIIAPTGPGAAIANYNSVTDGAKIVEQALQKWGRVDILINNAGILRDKSFKGMTDAEFDLIQEVSRSCLAVFGSAMTRSTSMIDPCYLLS